MSEEPTQPPPSQQPPQSGEQMTPEQEEMMRQMEEEMRKVRVQDVVTQSVVSILNLSARRIAKDDERDLEQARVGIEAVKAMVGLLEPEPQQEVRNALGQIQVMYAQHAGGDAGAPGGDASGSSEPGPEEPGSSSRIWTPGS
jgi:hypothetical protein